MKLSQRHVAEAEKAILSDINTSDSFPINCSISLEDYECLREKWILIQDDEINSYHQFASNANGTQSFGFYKANNGQFYIIEAFINDIRKVYSVTKNCHFIRDLIKDEKLLSYI